MGDFRVNLLQSYIEAKLGLGKKMTHMDLVIKKIGMDHERENPQDEISEEQEQALKKAAAEAKF
jgi:hypothetical protein